MPRVRRHGLAVAIAAAGWGLAFLAVAGGADECSAVFRDTMWKQSIPDHLRSRRGRGLRGLPAFRGYVSPGPRSADGMAQIGE
jgi:hypothetical protein